MKKALLLFLNLTLSFTISYSQIKVWSNGGLSIGTVTTMSDPGNTSGGSNRSFIDGGNLRGLYIRTQHTYDWFQSITVGLNRQFTVSYVVNYNNADRFFVRGDGMVYANGVWLGSDQKLKKNIKPIENPLDKILKLQGITYNLKEETTINEGTIYNPDTSTYIGFIAQDVEKIVPEAVREMKDGIKAVAYQNLTALLVEGIKEQQEQINELKNEISDLKKMLNYPENSFAKLYQNKPNPFNGASVIEYELNSNDITTAVIYIYMI